MTTTYTPCETIRYQQTADDREAQDILSGLADSHDDGAAVAEIIDDDTTERVVIPSMDARLAELLAAHDARHAEVQSPHRRRGEGGDADLTVTAELEAVK